MKTLKTLFIAILLISCSSDDDSSSNTCKGEFAIFGQTGSFFVEGVDSDTGEPYLSNSGVEGTIFIGCAD